MSLAQALSRRAVVAAQSLQPVRMAKKKAEPGGKGKGGDQKEGSNLELKAGVVNGLNYMKGGKGASSQALNLNLKPWTLSPGC
mmetsp:Transcript_45439/g.71220  ORF Transcript_45439/g.71220 Transcript_45439/m.71220 type:complete len:83 (+) Transcript_45439:265-513(+)